MAPPDGRREGNVPRLRLMSYNVWNTNPPRWLWRGPPDRFRQYAFRLHHLGDVLRRASADIIALQEVRYDSTLGRLEAHAGDGRSGAGAGTAGAPATRHGGAGASEQAPQRLGPYAAALKQAADWYNTTQWISGHPKYLERNDHKWDEVRVSPHFEALVAQHPYEGPEPLPTPDSTAGAADSKPDSGAAAGSVDDAPQTASAAPAAPQRPRSPYARNMPRGAPDKAAVFEALQRQPHAQIAHLAAHLPGYQFVFQPAQLYLDPRRWLLEGEPHREEEGPAIFSRWPIVHSDYLLLSRDASDEGDGHQRLCLHAVIDVSAALGAAGAAGDASTPSNSGSQGRSSGVAGGAVGWSSTARQSPAVEPVLIDVYTVHLALSERARNRTVAELREFVRVSARGSVHLLTGDMNAEPHEPAMRWLVGDDSLHLDASPPPAREQSPTSAAGAGGLPSPAASTVNSGSAVRLCGASTGVFHVCSDVGDTASESAVAHGPSSDPVLGSAALTADGAVAMSSLNSLPLPVTQRRSQPPAFLDAFHLTARGGNTAEPPPRDRDPALRRYAFTFPSDDPCKRIDLVLLATTEDVVLAACNATDPIPAQDSTSVLQLQASGMGAAAAAGNRSVRWELTPRLYFLLGQDALPGTEAFEGRGLGMTTDRSPIYASDHRAVVFDFALRQL